MATTKTGSILFAGLLAGIVSCASAQEVYKQVDSDGRTTFTDVPPPKPAALPRRGGKVEVNEAARRLKQAQLARKLGAQPVSGELNNSPGARTANYRYWRRQEKLRHDVEQAQRRARETLMPRMASQ